MLLTPFFFHFTMYEKAKKHPIGGHVCLTYCIYMQLVGLGASVLVAVWGLVQHYANQRGTVWSPWVPWTFGDWLGLFLRMVCIVAPVMLLISLLPYRYVKRGVAEQEKEEERKKAKLD